MKKVFYIDNKEFSDAVVKYVEKVNEAKENGNKVPIVPNYIGESFLKIAEGLSRKGNFAMYSYREEMVMDAVENCLRAVSNYDIETKTRTGTPNAFAYFTQICYYAFLRRLAKEKKQQEIKQKFINQCGIEDFVMFDEDSSSSFSSDISNQNDFFENMKEKNDSFQIKQEVDRDFERENS